MRNFLLLTILFISFFLNAQNYHQYVNPFIGTGGHGHTFPGATLPYGMVQLSPDTRIDGSWDGCSGYHYSDSVIYGFSHTHLNGTGVSDYGDIMMMPTMGITSFDPNEYSSNFSHQKEKASAGFYSVNLDKYNIDAELTTSTRVGFHKYKFHKTGNANIILDLNHRDKLLEGEIRILNDRTLEVCRKSHAWATNQQIWSRIEFNQSMDFGKIQSNPTSKHTGIIISKKVKQGEEILAKVSLSFTSYEGAKLNATEIPHWDFAKVKQDAELAWNKELSKIEVQSNDKNKLTIFYTAMYHTMTQPNIAQDLDGKYMGRDFKVHQDPGFGYYTVFSLWDTFRAAHPLYTLIDQKRTADYINTFIKQYEQGGRLPVWELASNETDCMIGYHSVSVMADAMAKGLKGFDYEKAFEAAKNSAMLDIFGLDAYKKNGFISIDDEHESVSKTLEYAYDDWCIAQMAKILNKPHDYQYFMERSQNWKNLYDAETKLMRPKKNASWDTPFDGTEVNNNYTEGNSWQYSFFVPQDIPGLIEAHGGKDQFEKSLDQLFTMSSEMAGRHQVDITGLIGQYAHGNEPSHHVAYLYNSIGKFEKTNEKVKFIMDNFYKNSPDGLIGNEDCGQMSAWYILSALGIYSVTPGQIEWATTEPYFDEVKINYEDGTSEIIRKKEYQLGQRKYFRNLNQFYSLSGNHLPFIDDIVIVPNFLGSKSFKDQQTIEIESTEKDVQFYYSIDNAEFQLYTQHIRISETAQVKAYAQRGGKKSKEVQGFFVKKPNDYSIELLADYLPHYHGGGHDILLDGVHGTANWKKGDWQGYFGVDFEAIIDLKGTKEISQVAATFVQDSRSWILMPRKWEVFISKDNGKTYQLFDVVELEVDPLNDDIFVKMISSKIQKVKANHIKVKAYQFGKLPKGHLSEGEDSYVFIDEVIIK